MLGHRLTSVWSIGRWVAYRCSAPKCDITETLADLHRWSLDLAGTVVPYGFVASVPKLRSRVKVPYAVHDHVPPFNIRMRVTLSLSLSIWKRLAILMSLVYPSLSPIYSCFLFTHRTFFFRFRVAAHPLVRSCCREIPYQHEGGPILSDSVPDRC